MPPASDGPPEPTDGLAARRAALVALGEVEIRGAWSNLAVPAAVASLPDARDRAFAAHLAYDTLRWEGTLDWALGTVLQRPLADVEPAVRRVLRLGALQLLRTDVPAHAVVDTAAALAGEAVPRRRAAGARGFVNGVLRALDRHRPAVPDRDREPIRALALGTGHPPWIVEELLVRVGAEEAEPWLLADDEPPGLTLRSTVPVDELVAELHGLGVAAHPGAPPADVVAPELVHAPGADPRRLAAVAEGRAVPQDPASMHVVHHTGVRSGDRVLDLCAGPGGKATHLARLAGPTGSVVAVELHPHRAKLVRQAADRQGLRVDVRVGDAAEPPLHAEERFDVVLLDAPCTGLGTGRRRPEVRWRRAPEDVAALGELQDRLLSAAVGRVRPGGRLTYAVCTWTARETTEVVERVEATHPGRLRRVELRQLAPHRHGTDGMFVASWVVVAAPSGSPLSGAPPD